MRTQSPDSLYRELASGEPSTPPGLEVVARPGQRVETPLRQGDLLLRVALGEAGHGCLATLADGELISDHELAARGVRHESSLPGRYGLVVGPDGMILARRVTDAQGFLPLGQMLLRVPPAFVSRNVRHEDAPNGDRHWWEDRQARDGTWSRICDRTDRRARAAVLEEEDAAESTPSVSPALAASIGRIDFEIEIDYFMELGKPPRADSDNSAPTKLEFPLPFNFDRADADGFEIVCDANRIELSTKRFTLDEAGRRQMVDTLGRVATFCDGLESKAQAAGPVDPAPLDPLDVKSDERDMLSPGQKAGRPWAFDADFVQSQWKELYRQQFATDIPPGAGAAWPELPVFPIGPSNEAYFRGEATSARRLSVRGSPQATLDIPLGAVPRLVDLILRHGHAKDHGKVGCDLTGGTKKREGLRSTALDHARRKVRQARDKLVLGKAKLSSGQVIDGSVFSEELIGFMVLLVSYLHAGEIRYSKKRDRETFAKAYLPICVHTQFRDMFHRILREEQRTLFRERFLDGTPWGEPLWALARRKGSKSDAGTVLFPAHAQDGQSDISSTPLKWGTLVQKTVDDEPLVVDVWRDWYDRDPYWLSRFGREHLFTAYANATDGPAEAGTVAKPLDGVKLELRRINFAWHPRHPAGRKTDNWLSLAQRLFDLAWALNAAPESADWSCKA